eukprot:m.32920 g.32920  ORF g.32920 m.32920 type:complete len:81 (-) comp4946_c0_seq1:2231-2473(-)
MPGFICLFFILDELMRFRLVFVVSIFNSINDAYVDDLFGVLVLHRTRANGLCCRLERNAWRADGEELIRQRDLAHMANED